MNKHDSVRDAVILGALLHDIGKFVQRAKDIPQKPKLNHSAWGLDWFDNHLAEKLTSIFEENEKEVIRSAINNHHNSEKYISLSDAISAGMERIAIDNEEEYGDPFSSRLISVFSRISNPQKKEKNMSKKDWYCQLAYLGERKLQEIFPIENGECKQNEYLNLLNNFNKEIDGLNLNELNPIQVVQRIYFLIWKYTWCIPSATFKHEPDISLFDHLKTTAAIVGCLYEYHKEYAVEAKKDDYAFQLVSGDISGIQSYIFEVLTQTEKVAKRLRSRSLFIQLISEVATHKIIHAFNLPLCNIIFSAGGNFIVLVPNIRETEQKLASLQREFDNWLYEQCKGEIYLDSDWIETRGKDLLHFDDILQRLKHSLQIKKNRPYNSILVQNHKWDMNKFLLEEIVTGEDAVCPSCYKHPAEEIYKEKLCHQCGIDTTIGGILPKTKFIAFFADNTHSFSVLDYSFDLWEGLNENRSAYLVVSLNDTNIPDHGFKFLVNHVPLTEDIKCQIKEHNHLACQPVFFDCISNKAKGDNLLGYLKADVDNMGLIVKEGFRENEFSISRFSSLSRSLEAFFSGYIQVRMENDFKDIYTVFSGGDDFFVVGPWNRVLDFAREMRKAFTEFTAYNQDLSFSSGIVVAKHFDPISYCAESVEKALKMAKQIIDKDRVTILGQSVSWQELDTVITEANKVINWLEQKPAVVTRKFVYNLRKYGEMSQQYDETKNAKYLKFIPLLVDDINRNLKPGQEPYNWVLNFSALKMDKEKDLLPYLRIIMEYVLTYTRGGG